MKTMPCVLLLTLVVTLGSTVVCATAGPQFNVGAVNNTGGLVVFVAVDKGIFAKHGIDGKVVVRNTGPELSKTTDRKSTRLNSSHVRISYAVFCLKKKTRTRSATASIARLRRTHGLCERETCL